MPLQGIFRSNTWLIFGCALGLLATPAAQAAPQESSVARPSVAFLGGLPIVTGPAAKSVTVTASLEARIYSPEPAMVAEAAEADTIVTAAIGRPSVEPKQPEGAFGSVRIPVGSFPAVERWLRVQASMDRCAGRGCKQAEAFLTGVASDAKDKRFVAKLEVVNSAVNAAVRYAPDSRTYGRRDYWAGVPEIVAAGKGDCEDYAILKMAALLRAGVPQHSMSVVVLYDNGHKAFHAVLAVATDQGNYILDNMRSEVYVDSTQTDYQPLYSLGAGKAWLHGTRVGRFAALELPANLANVAPGEGMPAD